MNFQKFIYDFLKFNDFSANFHDKNTRAEALKSRAMGVKYKVGVVWCKKQPSGLRESSKKVQRKRWTYIRLHIMPLCLDRMLSLGRL